MNSNKYNRTVIYMYRANYGIYTIITINITRFLINLFQCLIPLAVYTRAALWSNPSGHGIRVTLFEQESDQITSIPDVTIVYTILLY